MSVFNPLGLVFSEAFGGSWGFMGADDTFINFSLFWVANHSENCEICLRILSVCFIDLLYMCYYAHNDHKGNKHPYIYIFSIHISSV